MFSFYSLWMHGAAIGIRAQVTEAMLHSRKMVSQSNPAWSLRGPTSAAIQKTGKSKISHLRLGKVINCGLIFEDLRVRHLFSNFVSTVLDNIGNKATQNLCQNKGKWDPSCIKMNDALKFFCHTAEMGHSRCEKWIHWPLSFIETPP